MSRLFSTVAIFMRVCALVIIAQTNMAHAGDNFILLQSTTSTRNSGLLDAILPVFELKTGIEVRVVAVGTGQAIKNVENGDGDVLMVHAKAAELEFIANGWGLERFDLMFNDFVIVGPENDPANVSGLQNVIDAISNIAVVKQVFVSRGDNSGTHIAEMRYWAEAQIDVNAVSGSWYRETGAGMGTTLNIGIGMSAYVLTDRATWLAFGNKANHQILVEGDPRLFNQYGVILANPAKNPNVKSAQGQALIDWLLGAEGQAEIAAFKIDGQQLFFPNAKPRSD